MNIIAYAEKIAELAKKHPTAEVVFAGDNEGNSFEKVVYSPTPGKYKDGEFTPYTEVTQEVNSICIN